MPSIITELLESLSPIDRVETFREGNVQLGLGTNPAEAALRPFEPEELRKLVPPLLRRVGVSDGDFARIVEEARIDLNSELQPPNVVIRMPFAESKSSTQYGIPVDELVVSVVTVWEVALRVGGVLHCLSVKEELSPPEVRVERGSVSLSLGGGTLLVSGLGLIIAAFSGIVPAEAAEMTRYGGAFVSSLGVVDLALNWYRLLKEADKLGSEANKLESEAALNWQKVSSPEPTSGEGQAMRLPVPPASHVPQAVIANESRRLGVSEPLGTHLINQAMPAYARLTASRPLANVETTGTTKAHGAAAS